MNTLETSGEESPAVLNLLSEQLISFSQAAKMFPSFRLGRPVGPSCVWRWFRHGVTLENKQVVCLEAVRVAGRHLTSVEAVRRFIVSQQPHSNSHGLVQEPKDKGSRSSTQPTRKSEDALRKLKSKRTKG